MAFVFVPNADGGFDEGDRQTNPDTGVEYIYIDGAWRALGPDIADEFPELDQRYVKKSGDTMTGGLFLTNARNLTFRKEGTGTNQFAINPNIAVDYFTNVYAFEGDGMRFRVSPSQSVTDYDTLIALTGESQTIGDTNYRGTLFLNRVVTPTNDHQAANKWYVDNAISEGLGDIDISGYLPVTGGELTGNLDMKGNIEMLGSRIDFFNNSGDKTMEIATSGFIKSADMLRVVRSSGPILEGRTSNSASDINVKIESDGYFMFKDRGELYGDIYLKDNKRYIVQGSAKTNVAQFYARTDNIARFEASVSGKTIEIKGVADPVEPRDAVNLQYVNGLPFATEDTINEAIATETVHLPLAGGTLTGTLNAQLVKSTRNTGYAFEAKPDGGDTTALIRSVGTASFKGVTIDSLMASGGERPFELKGRLADGSTISKDFFYMYANNDGTASAMNYNGKITSGPNIVNKTYVDNKVPGHFTFEGGALYYNT